MSTPTRLASRSNPALVRVRKLLADPQAYRKLGEVWLEGDHLLRAALARGLELPVVLVHEDHAGDPALRTLLDAARKVLVVEPRLWRQTSALVSPPPIAALLALPGPTATVPGASAVVLDRIQDAGNLGSILRTAAAFGVRQVLALKGCTALWSPKVLRAAMGAHFALTLHEEATLDDVAQLQLPLLITSSHAGIEPAGVRLPDPCAWVFGHEGQGVADELQRRSALSLRIPLPGGEESLNVAAAAAVCLYESMRQRQAAMRPGRIEPVR
jgi:TrmH family RNA methyltransferase